VAKNVAWLGLSECRVVKLVESGGVEIGGGVRCLQRLWKSALVDEYN